MCELRVENGILIDVVENVLEVIKKCSGKNVKDGEVIRKFVCTEKATKFYLDEKCNTKMAPDSNCKYLWLDTGFTDYKGNPIFIALHKDYQGFTGHYTGTGSVLVKYLKEHNPKYRGQISNNYSRFLNKYNTKVAERMITHISDVQKFCLDTCNRQEINEETEMQKKLKGIWISFDEEENSKFQENLEEVREKKITVQKMEQQKISEKEDWNFKQQENITISLLVDKIEEMQRHMDEMLKIIEEHKRDTEQDRILIETIKNKNEEYKKAFVDMRIFSDKERVIREQNKKEKNVQKEFATLLKERHQKILVFGAAVVNKVDMQGIAKKMYQLDKNSIEFITNYKDLVNEAKRVQSCSSKYYAIIFGPCPHQVKDKGDWDNIITKYSTDEFLPKAVVARNQTGVLEISKESFCRSLDEVYGMLCLE